MPYHLSIHLITTGDAVLTDLVLKQTAFDDLDLPVRPVFGHVGECSIQYLYFWNL